MPGGGVVDSDEGITCSVEVLVSKTVLPYCLQTTQSTKRQAGSNGAGGPVPEL